MKIQITETTIAAKDVKGMTAFYKTFLNAEVEDHEFFFKVKDPASGGIIGIVPHNGDPKWDSPWVSYLTDNLNEAITHLKDTLKVTHIENFGAETEEGEPLTGVCFLDPEGHLMMLLYDDEL